MITPGQASETLTIPASTLRRWAARFADHLTPQTGHHRAYTPQDLDTFRRIRDYLGEGFTYDQIADLLPLVDQVGDKALELVALSDFVQALQVAADQIATLHAWKDRVTAYFALPWYKRMFTKPPTD